MYLVTLSLHNDKLEKDSNLMVKTEKLQSFDITSMKSEYEKEAASNLVDEDGLRAVEKKYEFNGIFVPEKGGSFELHFYRYKTPNDFCNESVLAAFIVFDDSSLSFLVFYLMDLLRISDAIGCLEHLKEWTDGYGYGGDPRTESCDIAWSYYAIDL